MGEDSLVRIGLFAQNVSHIKLKKDVFEITLGKKASTSPLHSALLDGLSLLTAAKTYFHLSDVCDKKYTELRADLYLPFSFSASAERKKRKRNLLPGSALAVYHC